MSRAHVHPRVTASAPRCLTVWLLITGASAVGAWLAVPGAVTLTGGPGARAGFDDGLVAACSVLLLLALLWAWLVTSATVAQLLLGRRSTTGGLTRRLVLLACGAALASSTLPAAAQDSGAIDLHGLPFPDRASASSPVHAEARHRVRSDTVVVQAGDSLWAIAQRTAGPHEPVDQLWRAIWATNRELIGPDPDLVLPGQRLVLPRSGGTR